MPKHQTPLQAARAVLGKHPADAVAGLSISVDALERLEALLSGVEALQDKGDPASLKAAAQLLKLARWYSLEQCDLVDTLREELTASIQAAEASEEE